MCSQWPPCLSPTPVCRAKAEAPAKGEADCFCALIVPPLSSPPTVCRAKAEALAKAQADAERAERDAKHAAEAEARRLAEAEAALKATLERKRQALAAEPSASDAMSVNVMVRAPEGIAIKESY